MNCQTAGYVCPLLMLAAIAMGLAVFVWRRYQEPEAMSCVWLMLGVSGWLLGYAGQLASQEISAKVLWAKIAYLGIVVVPPAWLIFVLRFTQRDRWLTRRNLALLAIEPVITLFLVWTTELHGLHYRNIRLDPTNSFLVVDFGIWFWVDIAYEYVLLAVGSLLLLHKYRHSAHPQRGQAGVLLIGVAIPWAVEVLSLSGLRPVANLNLTPFSLFVTGLAVVWGLMRFSLFDIVPAAHRAVVKSMRDGLIILDARDRIVDINPAGQRIIGQTQGETMRSFGRVLFVEPDQIVRRQSADEILTEIVLNQGEQQRNYEIRISPLLDAGHHPVGQLIQLHDISDHRRAEQERNKLISSLEQALAQVDALQGLLPVCAECRRIRDGAGRWRRMEEYVTSHSTVEFSHTVCPDCRRRLYPDFEHKE